MNGEWMLQVVTVLIPILVSVIVSAIVGYLLGSKRQKKQILRGHITETVQKEYPSLFDELRRNSEQLDNYLENPNINFNFSELSQIYDMGLDEFMKKHHRDLFLMVDSFHKNILPKFYKLTTSELMERLFDLSLHHLRESLPKEVVDTSERIAVNISQSINYPYYIIPDLLNNRDEEVRNKIEGCIISNTSHIYQEKAKRPFVIKGQTKAINYSEISQAILDKAKPEIAKILDKHKELKKQNDNEVRGKLLPLLKKYISNPI